MNRQHTMWNRSAFVTFLALSLTFGKAVAAAPDVSFDVIVLANNDKLTGMLIGDNGGMLVFESRGQQILFSRDDISELYTSAPVSITFNSGDTITGKIRATENKSQVISPLFGAVDLDWSRIMKIERPKIGTTAAPVAVSSQDRSADEAISFLGINNLSRSDYKAYLELGGSYSSDTYTSSGGKVSADKYGAFANTGMRVTKDVEIGVAFSTKADRSKYIDVFGASGSQHVSGTGNAVISLTYFPYYDQNRDLNGALKVSGILPTRHPTLIGGALYSGEGFFGGAAEGYLEYNFGGVKGFFSLGYETYASRNADGQKLNPGSGTTYSVGIAYRVNPHVMFVSTLGDKLSNPARYDGRNIGDIQSHGAYYRHDVFINYFDGLTLRPFAEIGLTDQKDDLVLGASVVKYW
jgi:hypothetical protein